LSVARSLVGWTPPAERPAFDTLTRPASGCHPHQIATWVRKTVRLYLPIVLSLPENVIADLCRFRNLASRRMKGADDEVLLHQLRSGGEESGSSADRTVWLELPKRQLLVVHHQRHRSLVWASLGRCVDGTSLSLKALKPRPLGRASGFTRCLGGVVNAFAEGKR
jgi:hypothetical protein